jgi:surface antigen
MKKFLAAAVLSVSLAACAQPGQYGGAAPGEIGLNKTTGGGLLGAAAGGLAGAQFGKGSGQLAATAAGVLLGGLLGSSVGSSLDRADMTYAQRTTQRGLEEVPTGHSTTWRNPDTGHAGTITPTKTYQTAQGQYCREFQQTISVGGRTEEGFGTACRQPDGSWKIAQ